MEYAYIELEKELKQLSFLIDADGNILKQLVIDKIQQLDKEVISLVLKSPQLKDFFTTKIDDTLILDKAKLLAFVQAREFIPNSFTEFTNTVGLSLSSKFIHTSDSVVLDFPYKDCVLLGNQSKEENEGVRQKFFHEIINFQEINKLFTRKVMGDFVKHTINGAEKVTSFSPTDNLIIKGNNLVALHALSYLYAKKVKLIYIDPPYNTESLKFAYNDKFDQATWLVFMKNRLEQAKQLLSDDGVIVVEIDYNQAAYLKILMDGIFGKENYINTISVKSSTPSGVKVAHTSKTILKTQHSIICYKKNTLSINPQYMKKDKWDTHYSFFIEKNGEELNLVSLVDKLKKLGIFTSQQTLKDFDINNKKHKEFYLKYGDYIVRKSSYDNKQMKSFCKKEKKDQIYVNNGLLYLNNDMLQPISKSFQSILNGTSIEKDISNVVCDFWDDIDYQNTQNQGGVSFPAGKKPEQLLYRIISMFTNDGDIILDYHLGSGTTCAVAHKMGRQYIGIEQLNYQENDSIVRLDNVINGEKGGMSVALSWNGGGSFISMKLYSLVDSLLEQVVSAKSKEELKKIIDLLLTDEYFIYLGIDSEKMPYETIFASKKFENLSLEQQREIVHKSIDKNNLYVDYDNLHDASVKLTDEEKTLNELFYKR